MKKIIDKITNWLINKFLQLEDYVKGYLYLKEEANKAQKIAENNFLERMNNG